MPVSKLFGTEPRTQTILLLALLGETTVAELSTLLRLRRHITQHVITSLEEEGFVTAHEDGRERPITLNQEHFAYKELLALAKKMAEKDTIVTNAAEKLTRSRTPHDYRSGQPRIKPKGTKRHIDE